MSLSYSQVVALAVALSPLSALAATPSQESLAREYEQVRRIAMRDPKVQAAYAAADQRLDEKIVKIDPALAAYVKTRGRTAAQPVAPTASARASVPAATAKKPTATVKAEKSHVVAKGETLSTIAEKHHVSVAALRKANHIQDERKLPIGQTLTIPATSGSR